MRIARTLTSLLCSLGAATLASAALAADDFPSKPVRIVVPVAAGGFQDIVSRAFAQKMSEAFKQPVIIDNRASAGSIVGTQVVAKSPADGYTLLAISNTFTISAALIKDIGYDPIKEFVGIGSMVNSPLLMVTGGTSKYRTVADVVADARANPGKMPYASGGTGATSHIPVEIFAGQAGINLVHVPYKGNAPAIPDVVAGRVMFIFNPVIASIGLINGGQLRALAITSGTRSAAFPNVPTLAELGYPEYDINLYAALVAPSGTPPAVLERINDVMNAAKATPELQKQLVTGGQVMPPKQSVAAFNTFLQGEVARYVRVVREKNIKAD